MIGELGMHEKECIMHVHMCDPLIQRQTWNMRAQPSSDLVGGGIVGVGLLALGLLAPHFYPLKQMPRQCKKTCPAESILAPNFECTFVPELNAFSSQLFE